MNWLHTGAQWQGGFVYDATDAPPNNTTPIDIYAPVDNKRVNVGSGDTTFESADRLVIATISIKGYAASDVLFRLVNVEDPNGEAGSPIVRPITNFVFQTTTSMGTNEEHPGGLPLIVRETDPTVLRPAALRAEIRNLAGALQNWSTVFAAGAISVRITGALVPARKGRWKNAV